MLLRLWALTRFSTDRIHTARVNGQDWGSGASSPRTTLRVSSGQRRRSKDMGRAITLIIVPIFTERSVDCHIAVQLAEKCIYVTLNLASLSTTYTLGRSTHYSRVALYYHDQSNWYEATLICTSDRKSI